MGGALWLGFHGEGGLHCVVYAFLERSIRSLYCGVCIEGACTL